MVRLYCRAAVVCANPMVARVKTFLIMISICLSALIPGSCLFPFLRLNKVAMKAAVLMGRITRFQVELDKNTYRLDSTKFQSCIQLEK